MRGEMLVTEKELRYELNEVKKYIKLFRNINKIFEYFTSSDPHHDVSKQPR